MKKLKQTYLRSGRGIGAVLLLLMIVGSVWDLPISKILYPGRESSFGQFFAAFGELPAILAIAQQARNYLRRHRVDQWQGVYPNEETFRADIAAGTCHVLTYQGTVAAIFTLTFTPEPAYDALTDGRWRSDRDHAAVLHRNAVSADFRGTGMADLLMQEVERLARESGAHAVRVDTHRHNGAQKKLLERHGYRFCGNILCDEPGHDPRRQAFEKLLK